MDTPPKKNTQKSESPTSKSRLEASSSSDPTNVVEPREDKYTSNEEVAPETEVEKYVSMGKVASTEMKLPKEEISPETEVCVDTGVGMPTILPDLKNESQSSDYEVNSAAIMSSKEKRVKLNPDEGESWKICNCQMSKCLKLYCKCFSAGVYCTETCSCVDCFNRPIHKDTILATRKKTESRNPGAFAPKVLSRIKSCKICNCKTCTCLKLCKKVNCLKFCGCYKGGVGCSIRCKCEGCKNKFGRKDASALHKRGCNCKKSNCRNRYCECYQRGVGCSINCSCEGCQNEFGRNDG